ncbi:MAG: C1 family peptidase [Bacteroidota bacterium]
MKRALLLIVVFCTSISCKWFNSEKKQETQQTLGLIFEKADRLAGIPMASTPFGGDELPAIVDLTPNMPAVGNQGSQQSCVAWTVAYALKSYQEKLESGGQINFSPSYIYNQINNGLNVPTIMTDALKVLSEQGVCRMEEMPYNESDWTSKPTEQQRANATPFRIDFWRQVNTQDIKEVKAQLAAGYPVMIGAEVSKKFISDGYALKESYVWKEAGEPAGGHAMLLVGYDETKKLFKLMNSWGTEWGDKGFGYLDYQLFSQVVKYGFVARDAYTRYTSTTTPVETPVTQPTHIDSAVTNIDDHNQFAADTAYIGSSDVQYNVENQGDLANGLTMRIDGSLHIPANYGRKFRVMVHIYNTATGQQVGSLIYPGYSDINGYAASYTQEYDIPAEGLNNITWWLHVPFSAINVPAGITSNLYAVPTLFIDNYGITSGKRIDFWLKK